jgi:hypothetical protein
MEGIHGMRKPVHDPEPSRHRALVIRFLKQPRNDLLEFFDTGMLPHQSHQLVYCRCKLFGRSGAISQRPGTRPGFVGHPPFAMTCRDCRRDRPLERINRLNPSRQHKALAAELHNRGQFAA